MKDQVLSIEQMQVLKELGFEVNKASIFYDSSNCIQVMSDYIRDGLYDEMYELYDLTFTLQDIIELMPDSIEFDGVEYYLCIDKNCTEYIDLEEDPIYWSNGNSILINTYNVLVWLAKHNYI